MTLFDYIKNIFFILIFLQITPPLIESVATQYRKYLEPSTQVGVIEVKGIIYKSDGYNQQLHTYFKDPNIKAILLKIECPGGASGSAQAIYNEIQYLKKEYAKPIISLVENICTSGGYYVAAATDHIIAPGSALIGSIGTSFPYMFNVKELLETLKVQNTPLKAGAYKNIANPFVPMTADEKELLQSVLDDAYQQFAQDVAMARKISLANIKQWGDGKIATAKQSIESGLIDSIGSASTAIAIIKDKALIEGEIEWVRKKEPSGIARLLGGSDYEDSSSLFAASSLIDILCSSLMSLKQTLSGALYQ